MGLGEKDQVHQQGIAKAFSNGIFEVTFTFLFGNYKAPKLSFVADWCNRGDNPLQKLFLTCFSLLHLLQQPPQDKRK